MGFVDIDIGDRLRIVAGAREPVLDLGKRGDSMRVHLIGNVCNNHFAIARALRDEGVDAHLFLSPWDQAYPQNRPESEDPALRGGYPEWIHRVPTPWFERFRPHWFIDRRTRATLAECDVMHAHGDVATWVLDTTVPVVVHPYGSDFFQYPVLRVRHRGSRLPHVRHLGFRRRIIRAYRESAAIVIGGVDTTWVRGYRLLLPGTRIAPLPLCLDTTRFCPAATERIDATVAELRRIADLVVFQPTRQLWIPGLRAIESSKGNDVFLRGLARAVKDDGVRIAGLLVDRGDYDTQASKKLIVELGIADRIRWIPPQPRYRLVELYRSVDLVVDGLVAGGYGAVPLEAMACGCPVLMLILDDAYRQLLGEVPPVMNAGDEGGVRDHLVRAATDPDYVRTAGLRSVEFVRRHHAPDVLGPRYQALYETVLGRRTDSRFVSPDLFLRIQPPDWLPV